MNHIKLDREKKIPHVKTKLRSHHIVTMPDEIYAASGIVIMGRRIKSLIFSTDIAIIRNCNADAVLAVYPFTPQQIIADAFASASMFSFQEAENYEDENKKLLEEYGVEVYVPSDEDFAKAAETVREKVWPSLMTAYGEEAVQEVLSALEE